MKSNRNHYFKYAATKIFIINVFSGKIRCSRPIVLLLLASSKLYLFLCYRYSNFSVHNISDGKTLISYCYKLHQIKWYQSMLIFLINKNICNIILGIMKVQEVGWRILSLRLDKVECLLAEIIDCLYHLPFPGESAMELWQEDEYAWRFISRQTKV